MSGGDKKPRLTDQQQVDLQVGVINATSTVSELAGGLFGHAGTPVFGTTDFENHRLNTMIDVVHSSNPADLEHASEALGKASKAISDAATALQRHLKYAGEDWKGQAGTAFQEWGDNLVTHTQGLAEFADKAKVQIAAAATGLASVRSSMPRMDTRPLADQKKPTELPQAKQVEGNRAYDEAVRVEHDRQEAINQMNRLASFYSVSRGELSKLQPPAFKSMPQAGVPGPGYSLTPSEASTGTPGVTSRPSHRAVTSDTKHVDVSHGDPASTLPSSGPPPADTHAAPHDPTLPTVGTEINSVDTLPPHAAQPLPAAPASTPTGPKGPSAGTLPPMETGTLPPSFGRLVGRSVGLGGATGGKGPVSAQGRSITPEEGATAGGRGTRGPMGPLGRASAVGQEGVRGPASATGRSPVGRGVTGGMPKTAGTGPRTAMPIGREGGVSGRPTARTGPGPTGAARTGGVVGGKPAPEVGQSATGARVPRGTVIGGEGSPSTRPVGERPGQRGVIGQKTPALGARQGQPPRRALSNTEGVVGAPTARADARGDEAASARSGLTRGSVGRRGPDGAADREARRQQHSAKDKKRSRDDARRGDAPSATD
ncbi:WXG100 family type VII secretion target [Streptomyces sp. YIM S03343]